MNLRGAIPDDSAGLFEEIDTQCLFDGICINESGGRKIEGDGQDQNRPQEARDQQEYFMPFSHWTI